MTQNLWDAAKEVLRQKFIAIQAFHKKQEKSQMNNQNYQPMELEKKNEPSPKSEEKKK